MSLSLATRRRVLARAATAACVAAVLASPTAGWVQDAGADEAETTIPIRKVVLPGGGRYFALPVRLGSKTLMAGIDTGSAGLRVLAPALDPDDFRTTGQPATVTFGSGTTLSGDRATADVGFGRVAGPATIEIVRRVSCGPNVPRCAEGRIPLGDLGLMGGGVPHQGAPAMIGLSRFDIPVTVPFPELGVRRWIVDIPNDLGGGRLVLNPSPRSAQGFTAFPPPAGADGKPMGAIRGCLRNDDSGRQVCGVIVFDTGAPGISVSSPSPLPARWPPHTAASLLYQDAQGRTRLVQRFRTGDPAHSSRLSFDDHPSGRQTVIHANASPYFCFDVMYEADHGPISLRPRASGPLDPHASGELHPAAEFRTAAER